jgi:hypothetical protein
MRISKNLLKRTGIHCIPIFCVLGYIDYYISALNVDDVLWKVTQFDEEVLWRVEESKFTTSNEIGRLVG